MAKELKNLLVNLIHDRQLNRFISTYLSGRLIDIGCGKKPYADMVRPYVTEHDGIDHQVTLHDKSNIDRFGSAYDIPAEDSEFDSVLCTAVLEHLEEPELALRECYRVLKQGGSNHLFRTSYMAFARGTSGFLPFYKIWIKVPF